MQLLESKAPSSSRSSCAQGALPQLSTSAAYVFPYYVQRLHEQHQTPQLKPRSLISISCS